MDNSSFNTKQDVFTPGKRNIRKIPFVELFNGRVQGVASSGSDQKRVYVSFFEADTLDFYCSTNNNRPCGGLGGNYACKHLQTLMKEAVAQYGLEQVVRFLKLPGDLSLVRTERDILAQKGTKKKEPASEVFSRFLNYLRYLELEASNQPVPEMSWFI